MTLLRQGVCVCTIWTDEKFLSALRYLCHHAGGSSTIASLLPTKTLAIGGDTRPDQPGVPALFVLPTRQGAKPRTPTAELSLTSFSNYFYMVLSGYGEEPSRKPWHVYLFLRLRISMLEPIVVLALMVFSEYFPLFDFFFFHYCFPIKFAREGIQFPTDQLNCLGNSDIFYFLLFSSHLWATVQSKGLS